MQLVSKLKAFVIAGFSWADALAQALGFKNAEALQQAEDKGKSYYLSEAVVEKLAEGFAEAYGEKYDTTIHYQQTSTGSWQFYTDESCERDTRHDTATKQWQRTVGKYHKTSGAKKVSKQVDVIDMARRKAERFAENHKTAEIRNEIKAVEAYLKSLKSFV